MEFSADNARRLELNSKRVSVFSFLETGEV